jgi:hypothetical protein
METGKTYHRKGQMGGREKPRKQIKGEREVALLKGEMACVEMIVREINTEYF